MLTTERAQVLTNYLTADPENAQKLLAMEPENALAVINGAGHDFTREELCEYCDAFKAAVTQSSLDNGELNPGELDQVAGGVVLTTGIVLGLAACFAGGMAIGIACGAKW